MAFLARVRSCARGLWKRNVRGLKRNCHTGFFGSKIFCSFGQQKRIFSRHEGKAKDNKCEACYVFVFAIEGIPSEATLGARKKILATRQRRENTDDLIASPDPQCF